MLSLNVYYCFKSLCRFFRLSNNRFKVVNDAIIVDKGVFKGLIFDFGLNYCEVICNNFNLLVDVTADSSAENLIQELFRHNIIRANDFELN